MKTGFSLYEAMRSYAGYEGSLLSSTDYLSLTRQVVEASVEAGVQRVIVRLTDGQALARIPDTTFLVTPEQSRSLLPRFAKIIHLSPDDLLADEMFLLVADTQLPFVMVGKKVQSGYYQTVVSSVVSLIDGAQTILNGYAGIFIPAINTYVPEAFRRSGKLLAQLSTQYQSEIVASWLQDLLRSSPDERLETIQQILNATYIRWGSRKIGEKPPSISGNRYDGIHQHQKLLDEQGQTFEAIGMITDGRFLMKCQTIIGALPVLGGYYPSTNVASAPTDNRPHDVLADFSLDTFMQQVNANGLDILANGGTDSAPTPITTPQFSMPMQNAAPTAAPNEVAGFVQGLSLQALQHVSYQVNMLRDDILNSGILQTLQQDMREPMQRFINQSADLLFLIDEIAYVQQVADRVQERKETIEIDELINAIVMTFAGEAERQGVDLLFDMPDELPSIEAEPEAVNRALVVLLESALGRIRQSGWIRIEVRSVPTQVMIQVVDNGERLDVSHPDELFQLQFSSEGEGDSTMGFVLVKTIMAAHQGQLSINQKENTNIVTLAFSR